MLNAFSRTFAVLATFVLTNSVIAHADNLQRLEAEIQDLSFKTPKTGAGVAGKMKFDRLIMVRDDLTMMLDNTGEVFTSDIITRPQFIGFRGPNTSFGFTLAPDSSLAKVRGFSLLKTQISIDERRMRLASKTLLFINEKMALKSGGFILHCNRSAQGIAQTPVTDISTIYIGCMTDSTLSGEPTESGAEGPVTFHLEQKLEGGDTFSFRSNIQDFAATPHSFVLRTFSNDIFFDSIGGKTPKDLPSKTHVSTDVLKLSCANAPDVMLKPKGEFGEISDKCLNQFLLQGGQITTTTETEKNKSSIKLLSPQIKGLRKTINASLAGLQIENPGLQINIGPLELACNKPRAVRSSNAAEDTYACFGDLALSGPQSQVVTVAAKAPKAKMELKTALNPLRIQAGKLETSTAPLEIKMGSGMRVRNKGIDLSCHNVSDEKTGIEKKGPQSLVGSCMAESSVHIKALQASSPATQTKYGLDDVFASIGSGRLRVQIPLIQSVNAKDKTNANMHGVDASCDFAYAEEFGMPELIKGCLSYADISLMTTAEAKNKGPAKDLYARYEGIYDQGLSFRSLVEGRESTGLEGIRLTLKDGQAKLTGKAYFLGAHVFRIEGKMSYDAKKSRLSFRMESIKLPLGITSKDFVLFIVKNFVANDTVSVEGDSIIIQL